MRKSYFIALVFLGLFVPVSLKAEPCSQADVPSSAAKVKMLQAKLLAFKLHDDMDTTVPQSLQADMHAFKDSLAALAGAFLSCAPGDEDPDSLASELTNLVEADKTKPAEANDAQQSAQLDHVYGDRITVKGSSPANAPQLLLVEFNLVIACGDDSLLLVYQLRNGKRQQVLRWQSKDYARIDDAFGDFFDYTIVPQSGADNWLLAVAHGHPWCTSNLSTFDVDVLQPISAQAAPKVVFHDQRAYRRDEEPVMKTFPSGFQLRMLGNSLDSEIVMRPVIYRYQLTGGQVQRTQPIATNGRDFVDEWLESPWSEAAKWSNSKSLDGLKEIHEKIEAERSSKTETAMLTFGSVRRCSDAAAHFQVELDQEATDAKGNLRSGRRTYFQIREGTNSFEMLSAGIDEDGRCNGPDIMQKR